MKLYSKRQVSKMLKEQRYNCLFSLFKRRDYDKVYHSVKTATEPEFPQPIDISGTIRKIDLPKGMSLLKIGELLSFSDKYEISIHVYDTTFLVSIIKDSVDLNDYEGDFEGTVEEALKYLNRINKKP